MSRLIDFYSGVGADHRGRKIDNIITWDDQRLEQTHDYIQWLFPLAEPSRFNPDAPLLTQGDRAQFEQRPELRAKMLAALARMAVFYGLSLEKPSENEQATLRFAPRPGHARHWIAPGNHNFLRITRILTSLGLVGLGPWAQALFAALEDLYRDHSAAIGSQTFGYWQRAVNKLL
jgi:hypothetical protein